ncbi:MAG: HDOD domain-containing protein [Solidesulfovibrio sp.]|uniref:EAL and HDOD domain-containing protein n=1 Tax=Solidesulfovibrio sp. TaxID=2910990 RepID=UPI002B1FC35B|nr:HDOD domain-containing protein [Solidesulfovibrio sp.]MEA4856149.1 HDOD domain-containing protein [Solidesulfovibrio sp.]
MNEPDAAAAVPFFFTKQALFDAKRKLWGYEIQGGNEACPELACFADREQVADSLASSSYMGVQHAVERGKKVVAPFDESGLLAKAPYALPAAHGVVKLVGAVKNPAAAAAAARQLQADGYALALEDGAGPPLAPELARLANLLCFDASGGADPRDFLDRAKGRQVILLAARVRGLEQFEALRAAGFTLFQGPFFKEPEILAERKLTSHQMSRFTLLRLIEAEDPDVDALAEGISADVSVSFRLLSYLNSAAFGFSQKIQSIRQAIMILGSVKMRNWLRAVLLADMAQHGDMPRELAELSLQRARFLELVATRYDFWDFHPGSLFLLGLFSLLDAILGLPMAKVTEHLPLEEKLKAALRRETHSEYEPLLELVACIEDADWTRLDQLTQNLGFDLETVKACAGEAMAWSGAFFATQTGPAEPAGPSRRR